MTTARYFANLGWHVYAGVLPGEDPSQLLAPPSASLTIIPIDITKAEMIHEAAYQVKQHTGESGLDVLINNAGIAVAGPLEILPLDDIRRQMEVNFIGQIAVTQAFLPLLRQSRGRIINIGSILGRVVTPFSGPYCASKFAVEAMTEALRKELMPWGIEVVVIEPTIISTAIWGKTSGWLEEIRSELPPDAQKLYGQRLNIMQESIGDQQNISGPPEEVARIVYQAATAQKPKARYTVGPDRLIMGFAVRFLPDRLREQILMRRLKMWQR